MKSLRALWLAALLALLPLAVHAADVYDWSTTAADNDDADSSINWLEGQTPGSVNNSARAMMVRIAQLLDEIGAVGTVGGTADAITLAASIDGFAEGELVAFQASGTNTGATTVNVNSLGAKAIRRQGDTALSAGDILSGGVYLLRYDTAYNSAAGAWVLLNPQYAATNLTQGKHTIWVPAGAMVPRTTNGAAPGTTEMTTNDNMVKTLDFDASTQEFAQFDIRMPKSWNEGTVTFIPLWSHAATVTNFGAVWSVACVAISDDDALDVAFGTQQTSTDTGGTTNDLYQGPESSAITVAGTPAAGDLLQCRVARNVSDGSDTLAVDARLHGVTLLYTSDDDVDD